MADRYACFLLWLDPEDCVAPHGLNLEAGSRDSIKVESLEHEFRTNGFDRSKPALVGYPLNFSIQLLSGTHRHEAAKRAGIRLPVKLFLRSVVEASWATDRWFDLIKDIPVQDLEYAKVQDSLWVPSLEERVDLGLLEYGE